jgi:hypothetical protein
MIIETDSPPDSCDLLTYYPNVNRFINEDGDILHHITELIDWWILDQFKKTNQSMLVTGKDGKTLYELEVADEFYQHEMVGDLLGKGKICTTIH